METLEDDTIFLDILEKQLNLDRFADNSYYLILLRTIQDSPTYINFQYCNTV
jgi:hypothetical protein